MSESAAHDSNFPQPEIQSAARTLRDMPPDVNYYVIVPWATFESAEWGAGHIGCNFDCHVISAAAVDQDAPLLSSVEGGDDDDE